MDDKLLVNEAIVVGIIEIVFILYMTYRIFKLKK